MLASVMIRRFSTVLRPFGAKQIVSSDIRLFASGNSASSSKPAFEQIDEIQQMEQKTSKLADKRPATTTPTAKPMAQLRKMHRRKRPLTASYKPNEESDEFAAEAIAYGEEFDLKAISDDTRFNLKYQIILVDDVVDTAIYVTPRALTSAHRHHHHGHGDGGDSFSIREFFVFSDGVIVYWNVDANEQNQISDYLRRHQTMAYSAQVSHEEVESMSFRIDEKAKSSLKKNVISLQLKQPTSSPPQSEAADDCGGGGVGNLSSVAILERYSFSHALALSAKIGVWENQLSEQAEPLSAITDALRDGRILWKRKQTLKKIGEFARLRHSINMTELLDADIYWDRPELERLYNSLSKFLTIQHRLNMMNKRVDYCQELVNAIDNTLTHKHASTLEWMIIILIVIEIFFDSWHFLNSSSRHDYVEKKAVAVESAQNQSSRIRENVA